MVVLDPGTYLVTEIQERPAELVPEVSSLVGVYHFLAFVGCRGTKPVDHIFASVLVVEEVVENAEVDELVQLGTD